MLQCMNEKSLNALNQAMNTVYDIDDVDNFNSVLSDDDSDSKNV